MKLRVVVEEQQWLIGEPEFIVKNENDDPVVVVTTNSIHKQQLNLLCKHAFFDTHVVKLNHRLSYPVVKEGVS